MLDLLGERRERLLVVRDPGNLAETLRRRYPHYDVTVAPTYLAGIGALSDGPARGLLVGVDPSARRLDQAVAGLRKAAGESSRLVLCCLPSGEPAARRALSAGADDYLICPPAGSELDQALAMPPSLTARIPQAALVPTPTWEEITALAGVLAGLGSGRQAVLNQVSAMIAGSLRTADVRIVVGDSAGCTGDPAAEPAIVEPIVCPTAATARSWSARGSASPSRQPRSNASGTSGGCWSTCWTPPTGRSTGGNWP